MKLPSKVSSYNESIIPSMIELLKRLHSRDYSVSELFYELRPMLSVVDFFAALDALFLLGKVDWSVNEKELCYVD